jgi:hypothetical protein
MSTTAAKEPKLLDNMCSFFTPVLASSNWEEQIENQLDILST